MAAKDPTAPVAGGQDSLWPRREAKPGLVEVTGQRLRPQLVRQASGHQGIHRHDAGGHLSMDMIHEGGGGGGG